MPTERVIKNPPKPDTIELRVHLPQELFRKLRMHAAWAGVSLTEFIAGLAMRLPDVKITEEN